MILFSATLLTAPARAADYRDAPYQHRHAARYGVIPDPGIRQAPPLYYVYAPPRYVQDTRTSDAGHWVVPEPSFFDRIFGSFKDYGY